MLLEPIIESADVYATQHHFLNPALSLLRTHIEDVYTNLSIEDAGDNQIVWVMEFEMECVDQVVDALTDYWLSHPLDLSFAIYLLRIVDNVHVSGTAGLKTYHVACSLFTEMRNRNQPVEQSLAWMAAGVMSILARNNEILMKVHKACLCKIIVV